VAHDLCYPDHHRFSAREWRGAERAARDASGGIVVSAKDAVRLDPAMRAQVRVLEVDWRLVRGADAVTARLLSAARKESA
jgi:tetraacyldisaccharide-1-P 4'-kinase